MATKRTLQSHLIYRWRLPITVVALLGGWAGALFSQPWISQTSIADFWLDALAWSLLFAGLGLRAWASREISGRKRISVVDTGPYAVCRNPLYWGTLLMGLSQLCFLPTVSFLMALIVPMLVYTMGVVPVEEQFLKEELGADYDAYCASTPRWRPQWSSKVLASLGLRDRRAYMREMLSLMCWLSLPLLAESIAYLRELPGWPHWLIP